MSVKLLLAALLAASCSVGGSVAFAETTEDVKQRMELYRQREEEAETKKAERAAEQYARTWKRYGSDEVNVLSWRQHKDGSWVADAKLASLAQEAVVGPAERAWIRYSSGTPSSNVTSQIPAPSTEKIWVKVRQAITVEDLSSALQIDETHLAKLNQVNEDHRFRQGDWLVVPSQKTRQIKQLAAIDISELRRSPPLQSLPVVEDRTVVRFGDTVVKIAQRYGLTLQELLQLNPGIETARLVVGSQVRLAQAAPGRTRKVLGLKPTTSGGVSWLGETTISGPTIKQLSPNEQALLQRIRSNSGGNVPKLIGMVQLPGQSGTAIFQLGDTSTSAAVGETIGSSGWRLRSASGDMAVIEKSGEQRWCDIGSSSCHTRQWRTYGQCKYDWAGWKLHSNGTRTTRVDCGGSAMHWTVGVSCDRLLVAAHTTASGWSKFKAPAGPGNKSRQGEDEMVAALCANV